MKKINTIDYGGKVILIGLVFLAAMPLALSLLNHFLHALVITIIISISMGIGLAIEVCFGCVLALELWQDRKINQYYQNHPSSLKTPQQIIDDSRWRKCHRES